MSCGQNILNELGAQADGGVANFLAYHIQSQVQRQLNSDKLRQLYDAYVTHGYEQVAGALDSNAHGNVMGSCECKRLSSSTSLNHLLQSKSLLVVPPNPGSIESASTAAHSKEEDKALKTTFKRGETRKMKEIEAQIRASQLYVLQCAQRRRS